jgi:hypothetical protein
MYSATIENGGALHYLISNACQAIRNLPGISERVLQSMIRRVHPSIDSGGGCFENVLLSLNAIFQ